MVDLFFIGGRKQENIILCFNLFLVSVINCDVDYIFGFQEVGVEVILFYDMMGVNIGFIKGIVFVFKNYNVFCCVYLDIFIDISCYVVDIIIG